MPAILPALQAGIEFRKESDCKQIVKDYGKVVVDAGQALIRKGGSGKTLRATPKQHVQDSDYVREINRDFSLFARKRYLHSGIQPTGSSRNNRASGMREHWITTLSFGRFATVSDEKQTTPPGSETGLTSSLGIVHQPGHESHCRSFGGACTPRPAMTFMPRLVVRQRWPQESQYGDSKDQ